MAETKMVALVTGGSRGIGRAICIRLAADGFAVAVNYAANSTAADEVVAAISAKGGAAVAVKADVSNPAAVAAMFDQVERQLGPVLAVVNNAGIMNLSRIAETTDDVFNRHFEVNAKGTFNVLRQAAKRMPNGGRIVSLSSDIIDHGTPAFAIYAATKAAIEAFTITLAGEMRGRNITVNAVAPGPTSTDMFHEGNSPELIEQLAKMPPLERLGQPEDVASVVSFLIGRDGGWVNGQTIKVNGGII